MHDRVENAPTLDGAAPAIAAFFGWTQARAEALGRRLTRGDLTLEAVAKWAAQMKIIEREAATGELRVRLFGTGMVEIYGKDLTGKTLRAALPEALGERLLEGYARAAEGCVVYENIRFDWDDGKTVAYERLIYPLEKDGALSQFAAVGLRLRSDGQFLRGRQGIRHLATDTQVLARLA